MEFVILFVAIIVGFYSGWQFRELWAMHQVKRLLQNGEIKLDNQDEEEEERTKMRLEQHGSLIYAFEEETDSFIAQGKDLLDLDKAIQSRFPGKKFSVREENLHEVAKNESV